MADPRKRRFSLKWILPILLLLLLALLEIFKADLSPLFGEKGETVLSSLTRLCGSAFFLLLMIFCGLFAPLTFSRRYLPMGLLLSLPCFLVAVNNFPFLPFFSGHTAFTGSGEDLLFYALECLSVGLFEELAFRGCLFPLVLDRVTPTKKNVFLAAVVSSAVFGAFHLFNLLGGAGIGPTLLQVSYSFLIGGMCSFILLATQSVWVCALTHAVYNFGGSVLLTYGSGDIWTPAEVILTASLGAAVFLYVVLAFGKLDPARAVRLTGKTVPSHLKEEDSTDAFH